jgi:hypothetical protein
MIILTTPPAGVKNNHTQEVECTLLFSLHPQLRTSSVSWCFTLFSHEEIETGKGFLFLNSYSVSPTVIL